MSRDLLSEFGPEMRTEGGSISGGVKESRDVMSYQPPLGPKYIMREGPGLGGGTNFGKAGSQGKSSLATEESGYPGQHVPIRGDNDGTQHE